MNKTEIKKETLEIVKQVRLSPKQRLTLVEMQTKGGRYKGHGMEWSTRAELQNLFLIEERPRYSPSELKNVSAQSATKWKELASLAKSKNLPAADRKVDEIRELARKMDQKTWWLTENANEYLLKGRVVISR